MFICDCHCDTLTELYKKGTALYENEQHLDIKRIIANGGGLQFCAIYVPTPEIRYNGGLRYTLCLLDKYKQEIAKMKESGVDVFEVLKNTDVDEVLKHQASTLLAIEEGGAIDGSLEALRMLYELGVRAITLTWSNRNDIADGINEEVTSGGLTVFGRSVVAEMNRLGMLVDQFHTPSLFRAELQEISFLIPSISRASSASSCRMSILISSGLLFSSPEVFMKRATVVITPSWPAWAATVIPTRLAYPSMWLISATAFMPPSSQSSPSVPWNT